jgi:hypothetical protein
LILGRCTKQYQPHDCVQHPCVDREQLKHEEEPNSAHTLLNPTTEEHQNPNAEEYLGLCLVVEGVCNELVYAKEEEGIKRILSG